MNAARWLDALRWSGPALAAQVVWQRWRRERRTARGPTTVGLCPLCGGPARFAAVLDNPRESPVCIRCGSVPRQRALAAVLLQGPPLAGLRVHESSPSLCTYTFLRRRCHSLTASYFLPELAPGAPCGRFVNVDLGAQPFAAGTFDLVVTLDVLEHVPDPLAALREIGRTLAPGGRHVFTVPRRPDQPTRARAELVAGRLELRAPAEYHHDPTTRAGSLVVTDWGRDLEERCAAATGGHCRAIRFADPGFGVPAPVEVFVHEPAAAG